MREKRGAVNWTIGKLINIILLIIVLVLVIYGITTGGFGPLMENLEMRFDGVLGMFDHGGGGDSGDCFSSRVSERGDGSEFLRLTGLDGKNVVLNLCDDGSCSMSWDGGHSYRVKNGRFEILMGENWVFYDSFFLLKLEEGKTSWELYNGAVDVLESDSKIRSILDKGTTREFSLIGEGNVGDGITSASWQNGLWRVNVDGRGVELFEDDDKAIDRFVEGVQDGYDDKVYWGFNDRSSDVVSLTSGSKKRIDGLIFDFDRIYDSLCSAEHSSGYSVILGRFKKNYDPWIRTKYNGGKGSSAYGPVQLTKGLAESYLNKAGMDWTKEERKYLNEFIKQGELFLKWGGSDMPVDKKDPENGNDVSIYDYGGSGTLNKPEDKIMYRQVVDKMLQEIYIRHNGDIGKVWREWRFGLKEIDNGRDARYQIAFLSSWYWGSLGNEWNHGTADEIDRKGDVVELKKVFEKMKEKEHFRTKLSYEELLTLNNYLSDKSVSAGGRDFVFGVEYKGDVLAITLSEGEDEFALRQFGGDRYLSKSKFLIGNNFENVKLRHFPLSLMKWNSAWADVESEDYYRLPRKVFEDAFVASAVRKFILEECR